MSKFQVDFTAINASIQAQVDAAEAAAQAAQAPSSGVSADQEAADIAAATKPLQDQIAALQADDDTKTALNASLQASIDKIKAILA